MVGLDGGFWRIGAVRLRMGGTMETDTDKPQAEGSD